MVAEQQMKVGLDQVGELAQATLSPPAAAFSPQAQGAAQFAYTLALAVAKMDVVAPRLQYRSQLSHNMSVFWMPDIGQYPHLPQDQNMNPLDLKKTI